MLNAPEQSISHKTVRKCIINLIEIFINQNTLTGPANCKKTTSHHYVQNQGKLMMQSQENGQKRPFGQIFLGTISRSNISSFSENCKFF